MQSNFSASNSDYIPCLFLPCLKGSNKLIIFFHGNAEDLGISYEMLDHMRTALRINLMAVEYPGYGIYEDPEGPSEDKIFNDADLVYYFVQMMSTIKEKDIILLGRSLGSGPATYLAANHEPGGLILMSPYTSIKSVANGKVGFFSFLLAEQFDNLSRMDQVTCPTFILHGMRDKLIPIDHAYQLKEKCAGPTFFLSPPNMTHNDFNFYDDLIRPLMRFLCQINILQTYEDDSDCDLEEPNDSASNSPEIQQRRVDM